MITRRKWLKLMAGSLLASTLQINPISSGNKPNILFIAIDDLNTWLGCLGHPDALTPNIDRLAQRSMLFTQAYTPAPLCNPSRSAVMSGLAPFTTGLYQNGVPFRNAAMLKNHITLPEYFAQNGYRTYGYGKIFHLRQMDTWQTSQYGPFADGIDKISELPHQNGLDTLKLSFDWGVGEFSELDTIDGRNSDHTVDVLDQTHDQPFFLGVGLVRPHIPWYTPTKYFDLYNPDLITLPTVVKHDLDDVPTVASADQQDHEIIVANNQWREAVHAYLAAVSFADAQVGKVLDALDNSAYAENTIVVLWSDHGFMHGQKNHWHKNVLWEEALHVPLMIACPDKPAGICEHPVSTLNLYLTLTELAGLGIPSNLDGQSLISLLNNPTNEWTTPVLSTRRYREQSVRTAEWRYTRYADKTEELYDEMNDPLETINLADNPMYSAIIESLKTHLPTIHADPVLNE